MVESTKSEWTLHFPYGSLPTIRKPLDTYEEYVRARVLSRTQPLQQRPAGCPLPSAPAIQRPLSQHTSPLCLPPQGGYSTHIVVTEDFALRIPDALPLDRTAPLLCAGITVYR